MCGIVAVFGKVGLTEERVFCDLLQIDVLRGNDSTGIAAIRLDGSAKVMKDTVLPTEFLMRSHVTKLFSKMNVAYIGHNRAATKGKITAKNAHPFVSGHIIGVHNGTLTSEVGLINANTFGTDSEAIFDHIRQKGIADTWENLDGAASLVWWDAKDKSFNLIRNVRRPLHFAYTTDKATLFVASEAWMIEGCVSRRAGINIEEVLYPKANNHFRFNWTFRDGIKQTGGELTPLVKSILTVPTISYSGSVEPGSYNWEKGHFVPKLGEDKDSTDPTKKPSNVNGKERCTDGIQKHFLRGTDDDKIGEEAEEFFAKSMSEKQFHKQFKGCTFCRSVLDYETSVVLDRHNAACSDCVALADDENIQLVGGM